jgi:hypothetical protein
MTQYFSVTTGSSYLSASDKRVHIGLGRDKTARSVTIRWPSGLEQTLRNMSADRRLTLKEIDARSVPDHDPEPGLANGHR